MAKAKRMERVIALTKILVDNPHRLFSFSYFCQKFEIAKSTLSEDVFSIKEGLENNGLGKIETISGAAGGVRFIPCRTEEEDHLFLEELAQLLSSPDRILPGGILYTTDLLCRPDIVSRLGEIFLSKLPTLNPDCIMTVETSGIPLAMAVARAYNVPLVVARHSNHITEGSSVNINYVSGSSKRIQTMAMPKRALQPDSKVLIVDDVMKGGGTAKGMLALAQEVGAQVIGKAFLITISGTEKRMIEDYTSIFSLHPLDEDNNEVKIDII